MAEKALKHREYFPVDVNKATREQLLRVPGFGVRNVERILQMRPYRKISLLDLSQLRVTLKRARYFVITSDHNPDLFLLDSQRLTEKLKPSAKQLSFFDILETAKTGEL